MSRPIEGNATTSRDSDFILRSVRQRWAVGLMVTAVMVASGAVAAGGETRAAAKPRPSRIEISPRPGGKVRLVVHYPWAVHAKASVELCLVPEGAAPGPAPQPLQFVHQWMKADVTNAVYAHRDEHLAPLPFTQRQQTFEVRSLDGPLGRSAVCVVFPKMAEEAAASAPGHDHLDAPLADKKGTIPARPPSPSRAVYYLLESWSSDPKTLGLDLPPELSRPGRLHVWFLRDEQVAWSEDLPWPPVPRETE